MDGINKYKKKTEQLNEWINGVNEMMIMTYTTCIHTLNYTIFCTFFSYLFSSFSAMYLLPGADLLNGMSSSLNCNQTADKNQ